MSCAKRYKIEKKIREAERKRRREARRNGVVKKSKKDPGIPNLWPYKEKLLNQIEESKRMAEEEKRRKRQMEIQKKKKKKEANSLQALARSAEQRARAFDAQQANTEMTWEGSRDVEESAITTKDNSRRAYYREFRKVVEAADVILEVLDARDPLGCRAKHVERFILDQGLRKRIILVLNKIDLVPRHAVEQWLK
jgi:nuclear GTP-binding protein